MGTTALTASLFSSMIRSGAEYIRKDAADINALNVFPIPDGDTGDNMCMTITAGADQATAADSEPLGENAEKIARGMLLGARGNSGVILSQFFDGAARGFSGAEKADVRMVSDAFSQGVKQAYHAVLQPTEGTILTVMREASDAVEDQTDSLPDIESLMEAFITQAKQTLEHTPDLLPVLRETGVIDSGGAGFVRILEGMRDFLLGKSASNSDSPEMARPSTAALDLSLFDENSVMQYGYCTEFLLRLQTCKVNPDSFRVEDLSDYLKTVGDSIVAFRTGTIVKVHVHTMVPGAVLDYCQKYGEFLTLKIENMSLEHNGVKSEKEKTPKQSTGKAQKKRALAVVAVASGSGIQNAMREAGCHVIIEGGQTMNPSAADFLRAFEEANAEQILVLPNNGNIILTARQAASLYNGAKVQVVETKTIGEGYCALTMLDPTSGDLDSIVRDLEEAISTVQTAQISRAVRDAEIGGTPVEQGAYIGFSGKKIMAADKDRLLTAKQTMDRMDLTDKAVLILIYGRESDQSTAAALKAYAKEKHGDLELHEINGMQDIYDLIMVAE